MLVVAGRACRPYTGYDFSEGIRVNANIEVVTFGGVPQPEDSRARAAVIPVPLERTVSFGAGTALGPAALMWASSGMELYDEVLDSSPMDLGILTLPAVDVSGPMEEVLGNIENAVFAQLEAGRLPVTVGGEHTVTLGAVEAARKKYGDGFTVLILDAHLDLRDTYAGEKISHACVARRILESGLKLRQVGIRSASAPEAALVREKGLNVVWAHQAARRDDWLERSVEGLTGPVYLSLDVDGLDPGVLAATGTPEPGGLTWNQVCMWLEEVCSRCEVIGIDLVELAPSGGHSSCEFAAARLLYRAIGLALAKEVK